MTGSTQETLADAAEATNRYTYRYRPFLDRLVIAVLMIVGLLCRGPIKSVINWTRQAGTTPSDTSSWQHGIIIRLAGGTGAQYLLWQLAIMMICAAVGMVIITGVCALGVSAISSIAWQLGWVRRYAIVLKVFVVALLVLLLVPPMTQVASGVSVNVVVTALTTHLARIVAGGAVAAACIACIPLLFLMFVRHNAK